jgi:uncharacterized protein (UPF0548 family)
MFLLKKPSPKTISDFLTSQQGLPLTYTSLGATNDSPPAGYQVDHNRTRLGYGVESFNRAVAGLKAWQQFNLGWVRAFPVDTPLVVGATVAIRVRHFGFWSLNACRIVYLIDQVPTTSLVRRFGFAYGTLPSHLECGEERFMIEWQAADDSVWYDILAFSKPHHWIAKLGYPLTRRWQKRFARQSLAAMAAVAP